MYPTAQPLAEELPPEVAAMRQADPVRRMYADETHFSAALAPIFDGADMGTAEKSAELKAWSGVFQDHELSGSDAEALVRLAQREAYPDTDKLTEWEQQARQGLREVYGDGIEDALADARLLVRRDPRLQAWLNETGLGSHPEIVKRMAAIARQQLASGKLKRPG